MTFHHWTIVTDLTEYRAALRDLRDDERNALIGMWTRLRNSHVAEDHFGDAIAAGFNVLLGVTVDARAEAEQSARRFAQMVAGFEIDHEAAVTPFDR